MLPGVCSLRVILGDQVTPHPIPSSGEVALGRGGDIVIPHQNISRRHVAVRVIPSVEASDLGSTNATTLYGATLEPNTWVPIRAGDVLVVGGEALVVLHDGDVRSVARRYMGRELLEREVGLCIAEHRRSETPFGVVIVNSTSSQRWLDVLAGVLLERDQLVVLSDTEAALLFTSRSADQIEGVAKALEDHLVRIGASPRVRTRCCPRDATQVSDLLGRSSTDTGAHKTTMRPTGPLVRNAAMMKLYALVDEVAPSPVNVLILGETGVGKDVLARALHARSPRSAAAFVGLNCSALPETLLESELFGHERGAFTGAVNAKPGLLETAEGGTLFLDEVGEMPLLTQAKFLRVLEDRTVRRVGGLKGRPIDVRIIAATNRDLPQDITQGKFRADLFYRLNGLSFLVPPLRERADEIELLSAHFMVNAATILNKPTPKLSPEAKACLEAYSWPGNIRELRNVIERAVLLTRDRSITPDLFPPEVTKMEPASPGASSKNTPHPRALDRLPTLPDLSGDEAPPAVEVFPRATDASRLQEEVEQLERARIIEALAKCNGNQTRAAALLGITRRVLIKRIERYNLPRPRGPQQL
jgi:two-component system response regulator AtoC